MTIRFIALDIDGTLLDGRSQLPDINRQAIVNAAARGIEIALVTGRRYDFAMPIARQIPGPLSMIVNTGAMVRGQGICRAIGIAKSYRRPVTSAIRFCDADCPANS